MNLDALKRTLTRLLGVVALALVPLGLLPGCVDEVGLVDRTLNDKMDKRMFEGVWMYIQTTVDVPYSTAISFTGETNFGEAAKIVFDIQENFLVAYPVIETIEGTEKGWKTHKIRKYWDKDARDEFVEMYVGPPVARWSIVKHFDVIRNYNTFNGAQTNEVVENTTDRPWYERDFIRVNWAQQGIRPFFYDLGGASASDSYFVGEDKVGDPDAMTVDMEGGYFDYVIRTNVWSLGQNRCSVYNLTEYDCVSAEVKARHSFRRMDPRRDYEPLRYHNNEHQEKFGFFLTERYAYDSDWGPTYEGKVSFANRWNLWRNTYDFRKPVDDEGNELTVACFADADCDREVGERCQKTTGWFDDGYCAVPVARPYKDRDLRPIVFHLNQDWHPDYLAEAYESADNWSDVFKDAVAWALFHEEKGQGITRTCQSHADCATASLVADHTVDVIEKGSRCLQAADCSNTCNLAKNSCTLTGGSCTSDAQCTEYACGGDGFCGAPRACSAANPCALGQTCSGGVCKQGGETVATRLPTVSTRGSTVIYHGHGDDKSIVTRDVFPARLLDPTQQGLTGNNSWVRFVNAAPGAGSFGLKVGDVVFEGGAYGDTVDYATTRPETAKFMKQVPSGIGLKFEVTSGGSVVASVFGDVAAKSQYLVVYNGKDVIVAGASFNESRQGIRFLNAAEGVSLDFAVEGVRLDTAVGYRAATPYRSMAGDVQRVTLSVAGSRGDLTCYTDDTIGRCVGWGADITQKDHDRVAEIKSNLPDMFVLCENTYNELEAVDQARMAAREGNARYTQDLGNGAFYNPCGDPDLIPHPTETKKIGDIRYSFFYWVNEQQRSGPLGYGPSAADPESGQILFATAYIYGGAMHTYGQYAADLINLVNGDLDTADLVTGEWVRKALEAQAKEEDANKATIIGALTEVEEDATSDAEAESRTRELLERLERFGGHAAMQPSARGEAAQAHHAHDHVAHARTLVAPQRQPKDYEFPELMHYTVNPKKLGEDLKASLPQVDPQLNHRRLGLIKDTWIEDLTMNNEVMLNAQAIDPDGEMSYDELKARLSPTHWASKAVMNVESERMRRLSRGCIYMGEFVDDSLFGLAKEMKDKGLTGDAMRIAVASRILGGVLEHEVGHTVGLRHNFSGSTDVFNFHDEYFQVREPEVILCQDDGWCDDLTGEACAIKQCSSDADCGAGLLCGTNNQCSALAGDGSQALTPTGVCARPVGNNTCTTDAQCGDGLICSVVNNRCFDPSEQFAPRFWLTENEKANKRTEYQYSTIMDYGGRVNSDVHGLGKYDYAAIKFGYTQLVDTYTDISKLMERIDKAAALTGQSRAQMSYFINPAYWSNRGTGFYHAFNYLTNYIGVEQNLQRVPRPYDQVKYQREMVSNDVREDLDWANVEVPYAFCSDEFRGNMGCYYFDQGIDAGEMAAHAQEQLKNYYVFDAFKRERLFFGSYGSAMGYYARLMDRYLRVLGDVGMYYAMWDNFLWRYSWYNEWKTWPLGGRALSRAAVDAFGYLKDTVSSPAPGCYVQDEDSGAYVNVGLTTEGKDCELEVPFGIGRFPYTQFGTDLGYNFYQHPLWFGSFWEKLGALITLTDSTAYFVDQSVGEQLNIGVGTSLGFNTVFSNDMNAFLGGIVSGTLDKYAGRAVNGNYIGPSVLGDLANGPPVEPSLNNFTLKLYAALFGLAYLPAGFDPTFIDRMAVFLEGEATEYDHGGQTGVVAHRFEDPIGGKVYVAYSTNYGTQANKLDIGATLVERAQAAADAWAEATGPQRAALERELQQQRELLDLLRQLHHIYGNAVLGL